MTDLAGTALLDDDTPSRDPRPGVLARLLRVRVSLPGGRAVRRWSFRLVVAAFVAAILTTYGMPLWYHLRGEQLLVVTSGSMRPTVREGDLVVVHPISPTELRKNMVVTFWTVDSHGRRLETHRIVALKTLPVTDPDGNPVKDSRGVTETRQVIQTQGDGNKIPDPDMTPVSNVRGVVVDVKRNWGRQILWSHQAVGRLLLFGPPLLLLLGAEVNSWFRRPAPDRRRPKSAGPDRGGDRDARPVAV